MAAILATSTVVTAQNLVPNPGFEVFTDCPQTFGIPPPPPWFWPTLGTADYFNACSTGTAGVPNNFAGSQPAHGGQAYAGIYVRAESLYREYIEVALDQPLQECHTYRVSFYVSRATASTHTGCAVDNLGAHLSVAALSNPTINVNLPVTPQVRNPPGRFLLDTDWTLVEGIYTASGGEEYLTIGNFSDDASTPIYPINGPRSFYYIDDVSVVDISTICSDGCITICAPGDFTVYTCSNSLPVTFNISAEDSCCTNFTITTVPPSGSNFPLGTTTVTTTVTDDCGNTNTCSFEVTVELEQFSPALLSYPTNISLCVDSNCCALIPDLTSQVTFLPDYCCTNVLILQSIPPGTTICSDTFVTLTVTDGCGYMTNLIAECRLIDCSTPCELLCASNKVVECGSAWSFDPPAVYGCSNDVPDVVVIGTITNSSDPCATTLTRIWGLDDCLGGSITCTQTVTVVDTTPPYFGPPIDRAAIECEPGWTIPPLPAYDDCCTNVLVQAISVVTNSITPCSMSLTVTWEATDCCGNTATTVEGGITVVDSTLPEIFCPPDIFRYVCTTGAIPVHFKVTASDACDTNLVVNCTPASGSLFSIGVTPVSCTVTDACGNVSQCTFNVTVLAPAFWQAFPAGCPDCGRGPVELTSKGSCLLASYPGGVWKDFDVAGFDRRVGHTWQGLPLNVLEGRLRVRMKPWGTCADFASKNDTISLGLNSCASPASWSWSRNLGPLGADPGLQPTTWCQRFISGCDTTFDWDLGNLPVPSAPSIDLIGQINAERSLDMHVQDDTLVDYALLRLKRCAPRVFRGLEVRLDNAVLADAYAATCLAVGAAPLSPFGASFNLGNSSGGRVEVSVPPIPPGGWLSFSLDRMTAGGTVNTFALAQGSTTNGSSWVLQGLASCTGHLNFELRNGPVVVAAKASQAAPVLLTSVDSLDIVEARFWGGTQAVLRLRAPQEVSGEFGTTNADEIDVSLVDCTSDPYVSSELVITASGVPEIGLYDAALELDGQYPAVEGEVVATVWDGQLVLSALDIDSTAPLRLSLTNTPASEVRMVMDLPLPPDGLTYHSNSHIALTSRGMVGGAEGDLPTLEFGFNGSGWDFTASTNGVTVPLTRVQAWHGGDLLGDVASPLAVELSDLPLMHWPKLGWFATNDLCHRFLWPGTVEVNVNGTNYTATEIRVQADSGGLPVGMLLGARLDAAHLSSAIFKPIAIGPVGFSMQNPAVSDGNVEIRWNGLGGVLESATSISGLPWTNVPNAVGGSYLVPLTNAPPASYFRVRDP